MTIEPHCFADTAGPLLAEGLNAAAADLVRRALLFTIGEEHGGVGTETFDDAERAVMLAVANDLADELAARRCRVCGCTDDSACPEGCSWIEADLCSACDEVSTDPADYRCAWPLDDGGECTNAGAEFDSKTGEPLCAAHISVLRGYRRA